MYIPFFSPWLGHSSGSTRQLERRKGGGGGGKGSAGAGGGSAGGSGGARGGAGSSVPITSASGSTGNARSYGGGSTRVTTIPAGQPFSGRMSGGGTRDNIYGNHGYPGQSTASVAGRGFPFGFWPIAFGGGAGLAAGSQFHSHEYGDPNNSSRPGGPLFDAPFQPPDGSNTYRLLSDNSTVQALIGSIISNCSLSTTSISAVPYNESDAFQPKPEQVIQYYRSSSISLTLDGYNNSAVFSNDTNAPNTPLPSNLNATFLDCLNQTIGAAAPLLDDAGMPTLQVSGFLIMTLMSLHLMRWLY